MTTLNQYPTLSAALVGCGEQGLDHIWAYQALGIAIEAVVDPIEARRLDFQRRFAIPKAFASVDELLANGAVDFVSICTPTGTHSPVVLSLCASPNHPIGIMCEKPAALNAQEVLEMIGAADASGVTIAWGFLHAFKEGWALDAIARGAIGKIYGVQATVLRRDGTPYRGAFLNPRLSGGGVGTDLGSHVMHFVGSAVGFLHPKLVTAVAHNHLGLRGGLTGRFPAGAFGVEDTITGLVTFYAEDNLPRVTSDVALTFTLAWDAALPTEEEWSLWFYGTEGSVGVFPQQIIHAHGGSISTENLIGGPSFLDATALEIEDLVKATLQRSVGLTAAEPLVNGQQAYWTQRLTDAIYQSTSNGGRQIELLP